MNTTPKAIVGIAGFHDRTTRRGGWAVCIRLEGREIDLYGRLDRTAEGNCELHAAERAIRALNLLRVSLQAIEVTQQAKQAIRGDARAGRKNDRWQAVKAWWRPLDADASLRVVRKPGDAYSAAAIKAEIAALASATKDKLTDAELDTLANRLHRTQRAEARAERRRVRHEREQERRRREGMPGERDRRGRGDQDDDYAFASGRGSARPRPSGPVNKVSGVALDEMLRLVTEPEPEVRDDPETACIAPAALPSRVDREWEQFLADLEAQAFKQQPSQAIDALGNRNSPVMVEPQKDQALQKRVGKPRAVRAVDRARARPWSADAMRDALFGPIRD